MGARTHLAALILVFLAACAEVEPAPAVLAPARGVVPDAGGLQPVGSPLRIDFWRDRPGVIAAVARLKGTAPETQATVPGCGDVVSRRDGLRLTFVDGDFRGWMWDGRSAGVVCA